MLAVLHIIICGLLGYLRFSGMDHDVFKDIAHMYVAGLFGYCFGSGKKFYGRLAWILSIWELLCFFGFKYGYLVK